MQAALRGTICAKRTNNREPGSRTSFVCRSTHDSDDNTQSANGFVCDTSAHCKRDAMTENPSATVTDRRQTDRTSYHKRDNTTRYGRLKPHQQQSLITWHHSLQKADVIFVQQSMLFHQVRPFILFSRLLPFLPLPRSSLLLLCSPLWSFHQIRADSGR